MPILVMKFGGTSLASPALIMQAAKKVLRMSKKNDVVVVVSAMAKTTDNLFTISREITSQPKAEN